MRAPVEELQDLAKIVRLRAIKEGRPYEIVFNEDGFSGRLYSLYSRPDGDEEELEEVDSRNGDAEKTDGSDNETPRRTEDETEDKADENGEEKKPLPPEPLVEYQYAPGMACRLLFWGKSQWLEPGLETRSRRDSSRDRWVFQPSGLCNPVRVQFRKGDAWIEVAFNPLTADAQDERYYFPE